MPTRRITIVNKLGLHARAAAKLVSEASRFSADLRIEKGARNANAKSIMGVMMLAAGKGTEIVLHGEGKDAEVALDALSALIADRFGEGE